MVDVGDQPEDTTISAEAFLQRGPRLPRAAGRCQPHAKAPAMLNNDALEFDHRKTATCASIRLGRRWKSLNVLRSAPSRSVVVA
jgi:hypothetical protein